MMAGCLMRTARPGWRAAAQHLARQRAGVGRVLDHHAVDDDGGARAGRKLVRVGVGRAVAEIVRIEDRDVGADSLRAADRGP